MAAAMYFTTGAGAGSRGGRRLRKRHRRGEQHQQRQGNKDSLLHLKPPDVRKMKGVNSSPDSSKNLEKNS